MSYTFKQDLMPSSKYSVKCPYSMTPQYITIHNTSNCATAQAEISYMKNNNNQTSFHVCVDEKYVIQAIPFNRNAWHSGDGAKGTGNRKSIGIEIARSTGNLTLFKQAEQNCAEYVAKLLKQYGWGIDRVKRHKDWSGKNCPHKTMELGWQRFLNMIQAELNKLNNKATTTTFTSYTVKITTDILNVRQSASATSKMVTTVKKNGVYTIIEEQNGWGKLKSGAGWINLSYTKKMK